MKHELISPLRDDKCRSEAAARFAWLNVPRASFSLYDNASEAGKFPTIQEEEATLPGQTSAGSTSPNEGLKEKRDAASEGGRSLFQEAFFFCTVKNVGEVPGAGRIFVETVVDRDSGVAFAKVYRAINAMNAVDILASRVLPFFEKRGFAIQEIHTHKASEYCGLVPKHPFETFLATSHIQHLPFNQPGQPYVYLCEQFYRLLEKEFFQPELRRKFQLSLEELQKSLDAFVEAYNASR
jgi:hypothetical protein